jgi:uncharacterized protein YecT (DUF1311 family)
MNSFTFSTRLAYTWFALLATLSVPAVSQDRNNLVRHCLSIADVNQRVDCLETGAPPEAASAPDANPTKQQRTNPSFDCRAARSAIERAICGDATLSEWDSRMGRLFQLSLRLAKDRQALLESQRLWLNQRDGSCGALADTGIWSCLVEMTKSRAAALAKMAASALEAVPTAQPSAALVMPTTSQARVEFPSNEPLGNRGPSTSPVSQNGPTTSTRSDDNNFASMTLLIVFVLGAAIVLKKFSAMRRKQRLVAKYGGEIAALIVARKVWQGMTEEQLTESWGVPVDLGHEIIRANIKETWKYGQTGKNRFNNRVYLENGIVIGWKD